MQKELLVRTWPKTTDQHEFASLDLKGPPHPQKQGTPSKARDTHSPATADRVRAAKSSACGAAMPATPEHQIEKSVSNDSCSSLYLHMKQKYNNARIHSTPKVTRT